MAFTTLNLQLIKLGEIADSGLFTLLARIKQSLLMKLFFHKSDANFYEDRGYVSRFLHMGMNTINPLKKKATSH